MRAYFFTNMYLSSIQNGIQPQHCTAELFTKYNCPVDTQNDIACNTLWDWAVNHKTTIVLNGGYSSSLRELENMFYHRENPYPWAIFEESEEALDGALTCVGIVLPEKIYETAKALREGRVPIVGAGIHQPQNVIEYCGAWEVEDGVIWEFSKWEYELCHELNKYGLAS